VAGGCPVFCPFILGSADATERLARELELLRSEWQDLDQVARSRSDATIRRLVQDLIDDPVCTADQVADRYDVSHEAARTALERLVEAGVLRRTTAARNLHIFEAYEVFAAIEDLERWVRAQVHRGGSDSGR
jgi:ribosomal protein S25